jgi:hypothetical protein
VTFFDGNFSEDEEWRRQTLGDAATRPHRITYRKLTRRGRSRPATFCRQVRRARVRGQPGTAWRLAYPVEALIVPWSRLSWVKVRKEILILDFFDRGGRVT